ncbi:MAG: hypothetical protein ACLUW6_00065 [Coriobacteriaceae bacterium]
MYSATPASAASSSTPHRRRARHRRPRTTTTPADPDDVLGAVYVSYPADELQNSYGTAYSSAGATFVVDSSGTIVLDANRAPTRQQGSLSALINDNADSAQVSSLLAGIARHLRQPRHDPRRRRPVRLYTPSAPRAAGRS